MNGDAPAGGGIRDHCPEHDGRCGMVRAPGEVIYNVRAGAVTTALSAGDAISALER